MATYPQIGSQTLIAVKQSGVFVAIAFQRDASFDVTNAQINLSNKTSGRRTLYKLGKLDEELTLDAFVNDDATYAFMRAAARARATVEVSRLFNPDPDTVDDINAFDEVESADAVITKMSEKHPDNEGALCNFNMKTSGDWVPAT